MRKPDLRYIIPRMTDGGRFLIRWSLSPPVSRRINTESLSNNTGCACDNRQRLQRWRRPPFGNISMKCMEEERPVGLIRADENVSWNGVAIGGRFFCTNHNIKPAHHQHLCGPFAIKSWSGWWDSNPRHQPWQGCALPLSYIRLERLEPYGVRVPRVYKVFLPWQDF